jgi:hypothetical protein
VCQRDARHNFLPLISFSIYSAFSALHLVEVCGLVCFNETVSYVGRSFYSWRVLPCRTGPGGESCLVPTQLPFLCQSLYMCCIPRKDATTSETLIHILWSIPSSIYRILYIYIYIYIYIIYIYTYKYIYYFYFVNTYINTVLTHSIFDRHTISMFSVDHCAGPGLWWCYNAGRSPSRLTVHAYYYIPC